MRLLTDKPDIIVRGVTGIARADFACLSKKCKTEAGAPTYELPVDSQRCPRCGSKRLQRLWNRAPGVTTGLVKHAEALVGPTMDAQQAAKDRARETQKTAPNLAVPISQLGSTLAQMGGGTFNAVAGAARPSAAPHPLITGVQKAGANRLPLDVVNRGKDDNRFFKSTGGT